MAYIIRAIKLKENSSDVSGITHFKLENGNEYTKAELINLYKSGVGIKVGTVFGPEVELVQDSPPYLRSKPNSRGGDNLLSLPRFK